MTLQITRVRLEQLRRFRQPLELGGFEPGLNIVAGPNEAGKSTLVRAIRAAFFERHRSTAVDDLRPWGEGSSATPTVELDFVLNGQPHRLVKSFLGKKRCTLQIGSRTLDGVEAEDHLAQWLGFAFAGKGASKPEHWGIPGLLWVEQGSGHELDVSHARDHLHTALQGQAGGEMGALAASGGDELLEQFRLQRGELLTGTGKPRGALDEAAKQLERLAAECQTLDGQVAHYRQQVDQLAQLRQQWQADEQARPWEALRAELTRTEARQQALQAQEQQWRQDQARLNDLAQTRQLLQAQLQAEAQAREALVQREQALALARQRLAQAEAALAAVRPATVAAQARAAAARQALKLARQVDQRSHLQQQLAETEASLAQVHAAVARADAAHQEVVALRQAVASHPLSEAELKLLRQLERQRRDAELRHQAVATRLSFRLLPGQSLASQGPDGQGATLAGEGELLLDAPTTLTLPGLGVLTIRPGGQDLAALASAHEAAQSALQSALQGLGLAHLAEAETRLAQQQALRQQLQLAEQALALVAPQGLEALRQQAAQAQARRQSLQATLAGLPEPLPGALPPSLSVAEAQDAAAAQAEQEARQAEVAAQQQQATAASQAEQALREHSAALAALQDPERQQRHAQARQQWLLSGDEHAALAARIEQAAAALREARPDIVAQDLQRLQRSIDQQLAAHQQRREQLLLLENSLQQASALNLEEQRESLGGELSRTRQRQDELQRRAQALDLLCSRLDAKRQATLSRLQAPLQARLQHYLPLLMPGASVQIDAGLAPGLLSRPQAGGVSESGEIDALSFGAREQLRLISRFAYADLLQQAGRPTLLILDDALVHSDADRLAQMKRVLFDVAQRHQLLLFTCHPDHWRDMGVAVRSLA